VEQANDRFVFDAGTNIIRPDFDSFFLSVIS
jgi:hypothetical protein